MESAVLPGRGGGIGIPPLPPAPSAVLVMIPVTARAFGRSAMLSGACCESETGVAAGGVAACAAGTTASANALSPVAGAPGFGDGTGAEATRTGAAMLGFTIRTEPGALAKPRSRSSATFLFRAALEDAPMATARMRWLPRWAEAARLYPAARVYPVLIPTAPR